MTMNRLPFPKAPMENPSACLSHLLGAPCIPWLLPPSSSVTASSQHCVSDCSSGSQLPLLPLLLPSYTFKEPCAHIGSTRIIQGNVPISGLLVYGPICKVPLLCTGPYSQVPGHRMGTLWGSLFCHHSILCHCSHSRAWKAALCRGTCVRT